MIKKTIPRYIGGLFFLTGMLLMLVRLKLFHPGQLANKLFWMMDENWQMFRADVQPGGTVFQRDQWNIFDTSLTNQAFRILVSHRACLNWIRIIQF